MVLSKKLLDLFVINIPQKIANQSSCKFDRKKNKFSSNKNFLFFYSQKDPSKYSLYIADDDGQAEEDFPPLTHARPIGQYDFPHLTLIEQATSINAAISSALSKIDGTQTDDDDDEEDDGSIDDSSRSITPPLSEHRVSSSSSGKPSSVIAPQNVHPELDPIDKLNRLYESLNQKTYLFDYYPKPTSTKHIKIRIDVSGEQIRFDLLEKTSRLTWQSMSLTTQRLVDCTLLNKEPNKKRGKSILVLVFIV
jgi:hypothetical protein